MNVLAPPHPLPTKLDKLSIFLAGSIEQGQAENWQTQVMHALSDLDLIVFNPRRASWDKTWKQTIDNSEFRIQVEWELDALALADWIAMYFAPHTQAPITLLELGLFAASGKILLCCPDGFWRKGNVDIVANRFAIPCFATLGDLVSAIRQIKTSSQLNLKT